MTVKYLLLSISAGALPVPMSDFQAGKAPHILLPILRASAAIALKTASAKASISVAATSSPKAATARRKVTTRRQGANGAVAVRASPNSSASPSTRFTNRIAKRFANSSEHR